MAVRIPIRLPAALDAEGDQSLLVRFAEERDESAFATLVGRHARMVYGVCKRAVRDEHLAEDAFQAVFLVLAKNPQRAASASSVGGWLFGIARRVGQAARRHNERRNKHEAKITPARSATEPADFDDLLRVLDEELAAMPDAYRAPLVACFLEERTQDEAAKQLGWSLSTLRRRLDHAKELLRARLTRRGATLAGGLFAGVLAPSARAALPSRLLEAARANPSPTAQLLAGEAIRSSVGLKLVLAAGAMLTLGAVAWGIVSETRSPAVAPSEPREALEIAPAPRAKWVTVTGRVVFPENRDIPKPRVVTAVHVKDAKFFGEPVYGDVLIDAKTRGIANAIVWLRPDSDDKKALFPSEKINAAYAARRPKEHVVEASPAGFTPRITAAQVGDTIVFGNPTPIHFNVHYMPLGTPDRPERPGSETDEFSIVLLPGKTRSTKIEEAWGLVHDSIHPWVKASIRTFDHPYFAVTDAEGRFTIPDAPTGTWRLVVLHEKTGYLNGAKGRLGERITVGGDGKLEPRVFESEEWDKHEPESEARAKGE
jgi:RNA polymerase sigma factor (sigma-70 family)